MDTNAATYCITDKESLNVLLSKRKNRYKKFIVEIDSMTEVKAKNYENDLNKFHASCGCSTGKHFLSTTIIFCALYLFITKIPINNWKIIIQGLILFFIIGFIGKIAGKIKDKYQFKKVVKKLSLELK